MGVLVRFLGITLIAPFIFVGILEVLRYVYKDVEATSSIILLVLFTLYLSITALVYLFLGEEIKKSTYYIRAVVTMSGVSNDVLIFHAILYLVSLASFIIVIGSLLLALMGV